MRKSGIACIKDGKSCDQSVFTRNGAHMTHAADRIILEARNIVRRYPGTVALKGVTYRVHRNQVNVLIGENGAGKSTLMRILAGVETADEGQLLLDGVPIHLHSPRDAAQNGISIVHQELSILPNLHVAENIFAGREPVTAGIFVDRLTQDRHSAEALRRLQKPVNVRAEAGELSLGCRQIVDLARALDQGTQILILDEPTSALSNAEAESLFQVIQELRRSGVTIIYISHRLNEVLHLGDHFTVLRSGRLAGEAPRSDVSREWIVQHMSAREIVGSCKRVQSLPQPVLEADGLTLPSHFEGKTTQTPLCDITFRLNKGEILGIYGLLGAGRTELLECVVGKRSISSGEIRIDGMKVKLSSTVDAANYGIFLVPEDRQNDGLFPELSIRENITLGARKIIFLRRADEVRSARQLAKDLNLAATDLEIPVAALSGGNQQKVLIARCIARSPVVLLLDEPTRGVDVGAKAEIYAILRRLAQQGIGILFASSEIEETKILADRVLVLCQGRVAAELGISDLTDEALFSFASPLVSAANARSGVAPA